MYVMHNMLQHNLISIGFEYIVVTAFAGIVFYYVALDATEKSLVNKIVSKLTKR